MRLDDLLDYLDNDPFSTNAQIKPEVVKPFDDDIVRIVMEMFGAEQISIEDLERLKQKREYRDGKVRGKRFRRKNIL